MQSQSRKFRRINAGLQNLAPSSTKISKVTKGESLGYACYRKGRFKLPTLGGLPKYVRNMAIKTFFEKFVTLKYA